MHSLNPPDALPEVGRFDRPALDAPLCRSPLALRPSGSPRRSAWPDLAPTCRIGPSTMCLQVEKLAGKTSWRSGRGGVQRGLSQRREEIHSRAARVSSDRRRVERNPFGPAPPPETPLRRPVEPAHLRCSHNSLVQRHLLDVYVVAQGLCLVGG